VREEECDDLGLERLKYKRLYFVYYKEKEANKGVWGMPRLSETTKDVVSCEKLRVGANNR